MAFCDKCGGLLTFKDNGNNVSVKCWCEIVFIRTDKSIKIITKREYDNFKKRQ